MFKFLRKILVLGLVFSLSIPSFAAVSVSDGSAFVSKAEFSASLNNLSSRMSNLENSLDAKIDSLVSSYLSRNGIWNGEKQTLIKSDGSISDGKYLTDKFCATLIGYSSNFTLTTNDVSLSHVIVSAFTKSSKSGLGFLEFEVFSNNNGYNELFVKPKNKDNGGITGVFSVGFFTNTKGSKTELINSITLAFNSETVYPSYYDQNGNTLSSGVDSSTRVYIPMPWGRHMIFGFVSKNDFVSLASQLKAYPAWHLPGGWDFGNEGSICLTINSFTVY